MTKTTFIAALELKANDEKWACETLLGLLMFINIHPISIFQH